MITPNKFTTFEQSALSKLVKLLSDHPNEISISGLYAAHQREFTGIDQFLYAVDVLYVLGRVELNQYTGKIKYASANSMQSV